MSYQPPILSARRLHERDTLAAMDRACREWGVFFLADHRLHDSGGLLECARRFFHQPLNLKHRVRRTQSNPWGFFDEELTKNTRDWKEIYDVGPEKGDWVPQWPERNAAFRALCEAHYAACEALSFELLCAISGNLGVAGDFLFHAFEPDHASFLRLNYYPTCAAPAAPATATTPQDGYLGVNHHTDSGVLTLLASDGEPGLEVFLDEAWRSVVAPPGVLIVNIGDVVQVWSNDRYRAPLHRVRCRRNRERLSAPFFFNPRESFDYSPLSTAASNARPRYRAINFGEFRSRRVAGDYADLGDEIQIDDYRLGAGEV